MPGRDRPQWRRQDHHHPHVPGPHRTGRGRNPCPGPADAARRAGDQGAAGRGEPVRHARPRFQLRREPAGVRPLLRHGGTQRPGADPAIAGVRRAFAQGRCQAGELSGGMRRRLSLARPGQRPPPADAGRTHHRAGPAGAAPDVGAAAGAAAAGQVHPAHHALHGRGGTPVRPPAGAGPRPQDRRRPAPRPDRRAPGARCRGGLWQWRPVARPVAAQGARGPYRGERGNGLLLHPGRGAAAGGPGPRAPKMRTLHRPPTSRTCSSSSRAGRSGRAADDLHQSAWRAPQLDALVAGVPPQPAGVAQAGHSQPDRQHRRAADLAGGLRLRHGRAGGPRALRGLKCPTSCSPAAPSA